MNRKWSSSSGEQLGILLQMAETSLRVTELAETHLKWASSAWTARETRIWMDEQGFDAAPVDDPQPRRVVVADSLEPSSQPVVLQARPLDATLLVSSDLSLADGIMRLKEQQFYFVLQRDRVLGIVTRADLQRPAVSMIIFSLILASEAAIREIVSKSLPSWFDRLSPSAKMKVEEVFKVRVKTDTQVAKIDCLMIHDLLSLMPKCPGVIQRLGFSGNQFKHWKKQLRELRDMLAHGGGLLGAQPEPLSAIQLFEDALGFAEKTASLVKETDLIAPDC